VKRKKQAASRLPKENAWNSGTSESTCPRDQARTVLEQASSRAAAESVQEDWANPFGFFFPEDASLTDVHRIAYTAFIHVLPVIRYEHVGVIPGEHAESGIPGA
jgi:hypothetical protein